jgi:hypothetical protein
MRLVVIEEQEMILWRSMYVEVYFECKNKNDRNKQATKIANKAVKEFRRTFDKPVKKPTPPSCPYSDDQIVSCPELVTVLRFGKYKGKTMGQVYYDNPQYFDWCFQNASTGNQIPDMRKVVEYLENGPPKQPEPPKQDCADGDLPF